MTELWRYIISGVVVVLTAIIIGVLRWAWNQNQRVDTMYQHLFGVTGKNGQAGRVTMLEQAMLEISPGRRLDALENLARHQGEMMLQMRTDVISQAMSKVASQMTEALGQTEERLTGRLEQLEQRMERIEERRQNPR